MEIKYVIISVLFLCSNLYLNAQKSTSSFSKLLLQLQKEPVEEQSLQLEAYIQKAGKTPIIEGNRVVFLAKGDLHDSPILLADFNGFMNPRYVKEKNAGTMRPIAETNWYYLEKELQPNAIINYLLHIGEQTKTDPLNPDMRFSFGNLYSVVQMPEFEIPKETILDFSIPQGTILKDSIQSNIMGHTRTLHIYLPHGYESMENLSTVFFHDGTYYVQQAAIPRILDKLIAQQKIEPLIAVFDDPVIRGKEYRGDPDYRNYLKTELLPYIDGTFKTVANPNHRAIIGGSRGGLSALYVSHGLDVFSKCGAFSPAIHPKPVEEFISELESFGKQPRQVFITGAVYDYIWYKDAVILKDYFQNTNLDFQYLEQVTGHNIPAWRSLADDLLIAFFPFKG